MPLARDVRLGPGHIMLHGDPGPLPKGGSVTARHSSSARQSNFAALNTGRHLYFPGRLSRSASAHILVLLLLLLLLLFSSPNLSGLRLDVYHTSTHGVALV